MTEELAKLQKQVRDLAATVAQLQGAQDNPKLYPPVFPARLTGGKKFQELTVANATSLSDFQDGRKITSDSDPGALIDATEAALVLEARDVSDYRFLLIRIGATPVKIVSAASGGGKYNGNIILPPTNDILAAGTLVDTDAGALGDGVLVLNFAESGQNTHDLTDGTPVSKVFPAFFLHKNADNTKVFWINGYDFNNCT